ncbi:MAG TPA: hypothetical protein VNW94_18010 [Streptosporangiaceae bacterium]|nr:hypothetical protein [Streptosporangiaceae bacterium]
MGTGLRSANAYDATEGHREATGASAFAYSDGGARTVHPDLDPFGVGLRESRDCAEHPESLAVAVLFDVTGSMRWVPRTLQAKLPELLGLLRRKGYVEHPQVMFGAIGDATCDRAPLQIGQFESGNRMDDDLGKILLEGGGGGGRLRESYELAMYFMARHTSIDCLEKRGKRGYLFIIGDERAYPKLKAREVRRVVGDGLRDNCPLAFVLFALQRMYDVYFIIPEEAQNSGNAEVAAFWRSRLGRNVIQLDDLDATCETIALTIGLAEGAIDLDGHLREYGSPAGRSVHRALNR